MLQQGPFRFARVPGDVEAQTRADVLFGGTVFGQDLINNRGHLPTEWFKILFNAAEGGPGIRCFRV